MSVYILLLASCLWVVLRFPLSFFWGGAAFPPPPFGWCCRPSSLEWCNMCCSFRCCHWIALHYYRFLKTRLWRMPSGKRKQPPSKARWSSTKRRALSGPRHCVEMRPTRFFFGHIWDCVKLFFLRVQGIVWVMEGGAVVSGQIRWSFGASDVLQNMSVGTLVRLCCLCVYLDVIHQVICHTTHVPYALQV